jgi:hypothetical protein
MEIQHNHNAKSQLAKLLAIENITVQHNPGVKTAMFDVKNRVLILPVWRDISNDLYDMLVVHEVGHALDTPADFVPALQSIANRLKASVRLLKGYLNVIEDARIDKRQKRRYPGSRRNYLKGYAELVERDFFGTARRDINTMTFIDRINIHFKAGVAAGVKFSREELPFVKRIENAETFEEILQLTEDVYLFAKQQKQDHQEIDPNDMGEPDEGEGDGEGDDTRDSDEDFDWGDDSDYGDDTEDTDGEDTDGEESDEDANSTDGDGDEESDEDEGEDTESNGESDDDADAEDGDEGDEDSDDESDDISAGGKDEKYADNEEPEESETEKAWEDKQKELLADSDIEYQYVKLSTPNLSAIVDDYKVVYSQMGKQQEHEFGNSWYSAIREELNAFKASENATISYMVKEFEMRKSADEYARTSISKTGVIDTNKLHSYKYNDDIFRRITSVATGKNHGFVMFVDWSGSMDISIKKTLKQMFSLAWFCKRVQIPFEVYSFRSMNTTDGNVITPQWSKNNGEIEMANFKLRNILSSRMNIADMNNAMFRLYAFACGSHFQTDRMSSTPLNEAIVAAQAVVNQFRARSKVQVVNTIFLTDGESDGNWMVHGTNPYLPPNKKRKCIIQDTVTKKDYDLGTMAHYQSGLGDSRVFTATLLKILKDHTQCNLIGFFIYHDSARNLLRQFYPKVYDPAKQKEIIKEFENSGFITVTTEGYDENYILRSSSLDIRRNQLNIDPKNMSKNKIAKQFMSFSEKKAINRVLLQRFIKKIAA